MAPPPEPVLRAAIRWLERLPASGYKRCREIFTTHADFSDLTPTQYDAAYTWISKARLLDTHGGALVRQRVFEAVLLDLSWFQDADALIQGVDELPGDAIRAAEALGFDSLQAFQHVHSLWGKVDTVQRARVGAAGEAALVELLMHSLAARVTHVSQYSDGCGFDIMVESGSRNLHIEAKSTLRRHQIIVFLSRHEYQVMLQDPAWQLVVVRLSESLKAEAVCSVSREWIGRHVPRDNGIGGRWESCRLRVPLDAIVSGIAQLSPFFNETRSPIIDGTVEW
ncbi:hypothetical protein [Nonomuraea sp. NPDC049709]|uniref:hypothetical protein n=1 Tax=Nonomuraea sp. NPDC049709 TaxID=3154736 RepID=UPI003425F68C